MTTTSATTTAIQRVKITEISPARRISTGVVEILVAVFIFFCGLLEHSNQKLSRPLL